MLYAADYDLDDLAVMYQVSYLFGRISLWAGFVLQRMMLLDITTT